MGKEDYNEKNNEKKGGEKQYARLTSSYKKKKSRIPSGFARSCQGA